MLRGKTVRQTKLITMLCLLMTLCDLSFSRTSKGAKKVPLLSDGQMLKAVDGTVRGQPNEPGRWQFTLRADLAVGDRMIPAGTAYEFLPCHALESLVVDSNQYTRTEYRLVSAQVTQYRGRNYLYLKNFVPLITRPVEASPPPTTSTGEPNQPHTLGIPPDVLSQMENDGASSERPGPRMAIKKDALVFGRRAFSETTGEVTTLILTGMGQNVSQKPIRVLPSRMRDKIEGLQRWYADPLMFRVAGVQTQFQGQPYILLHQAVQLFDYGNLGNQ